MRELWITDSPQNEWLVSWNKHVSWNKQDVDLTTLTPFIDTGFELWNLR